MSRRLLIPFLIVLLVVPASGAEWTTPPPNKNGSTVEPEILSVFWEGQTDLEMLKQAKLDLARAQENKMVLSITLLSPGGPVITSLEIGRQIWLARQKGLVVEIQGVGLVASGGTFVLASGTPGRRFISAYALVILHPPQLSSFMGSQCVSFSEKPKDQGEKITNALLVIMRDMYMKFTGKPQTEVERWLTCGNEMAGGGQLAVSLGLADAVRE